MPFEPSHQKTGGRKAGTPNKAADTIKSKIAALIDEKFDSITDDLELMEPKDRVAAYLRMLEYILPKQREQKVDLSTLSEEQLDELLNKALAKLD